MVEIIIFIGLVMTYLAFDFRVAFYVQTELLSPDLYSSCMYIIYILLSYEIPNYWAIACSSNLTYINTNINPMSVILA